MNDFLSYRFLFALIIGGILMWHIYDDEKLTFSVQPNIYAYGCLLLVYMGAISLALLLADEWESAWNQILTMWFDTFFSISIYYCVIVFLIRPLRRILRARTCALLWVVPNYLHFLHRGNINMEQEKPLLILSLPENGAAIVFLIWLAGCLGILAYHTVNHLLFRKKLLAGSRPVTGQDILTLWEEEKERTYLSEKAIPLVISSHTSTPLSIGLFEKSIRVVLPEREYTKEELRLIFRHELTHISRKDSSSKLFLVLCNALCWFNPFLWFAVKRCAEDIELSCDEQVLQQEEEDVRKFYAGLILSAAGDQRGFTTCLSATVRSMTYRLKNILHPKKKIRGGWIAALVFVLLAASSGQISLAYGQESGGHIIYRDMTPTQCRIQTVSLPNENHYSTLSCRDPEALGAYLSGLTLNRITGNYTLSHYDRTFYLYLSCGDAWQVVTIKDQLLTITPIMRRGSNESCFLIEDTVDWDYLESLMEYGPSLRLRFLTEEGMKITNATVYNLDRVENGNVIPVRRGSETTDISYLLDETTTRITLEFSHMPAQSYTVTVENWDRTEKTVLTMEPSGRSVTIALPYSRAHYTVHAKLDAGEGAFYQAEFRFDCHDFVTEE